MDSLEKRIKKNKIQGAAEKVKDRLRPFLVHILDSNIFYLFKLYWIYPKEKSFT